MDQASHNRQIRQNLRQATLILPRTGERVKRVFTLQSPEEENPDPLAQQPTANESDSEEAPLLRRGSRSTSSRSLNRRSKLRWPRRKDYGKILVHRVRKGAKKAYAFATSKTGINIFKCTLVYLAGSMGTFADPLAEWLGRHNDGKHMIATCAVYFHPARSAGSMAEATFVAILAFLYAAIVSFSSMAVSILFGKRGLIELGHAIVLIVFCGGGLGLVGWTKQKLGNPLVNVACSLTSLALITVLTKEGAVQAGTFSYVKVLQVLKMVILAILFSSFINVAIAPTSARKELRQNLIRTTDLLGNMLTTITRSFLSGSDTDLLDPDFKSASAKAKAAFGTLGKQLKEARNEHFALGTEDEYKIEARLVKILEEMSQSIGGLRSAAATQFALIKEPPGAGAATPASPGSTISRSGSFVASPTEQQGPNMDDVGERIGGLASIAEQPEDALSILSIDREERRELFHVQKPSGPPSALGTSTTPDDIFAIFISHLGPPMKSLAFTLKGVLDELPFGPESKTSPDMSTQFRSSLADAIELFSKARKEGLKMLYQTKIMARTGRSTEIAADFEEVAASCGYFSSSLQDFAEDMLSYLDILEELRIELGKGQRRRSWKWLLFWRRNKKADADEIPDPPLPTSRLEDSTERGTNDQRTPMATQSISVPRKFNQLKPSDNRPWSQRVLQATEWLRRDDTKYAVKVGIGAMLWAMWSYIPLTRPYYGLWRGEWGLLSYMLVCSMTIGASNTTGWQRFSGTCLGAVFAVVAWLVSHGNPFALAFLGCIVASYCFYIIVGQGRGPMGRFIMLTYNLSCLYAYSLTVDGDDGDEDEGGQDPNIWEIVMHRVVAVMFGCIWGIVITRVIWPISARDKLQNGISLLWLRMALIWRRDPLAILMDSKDTESRTVRRAATGIKVSGTAAAAYMDIRESLELRRYLRHLEALRKSAQSEFQLKGPFHDKEYGAILAATDRMLDAFHAMNVVIAKDLKASPGETALLRYTVNERMALSKRISHLFSVMASSMHMAYPLNDALPPIVHSRDRLLAKIFEFRREENAEEREKATDEDFELLYAYALVTGQIAQDIQSVGADIERLYGVLDEEDLKLQ